MLVKNYENLSTLGMESILFFARQFQGKYYTSGVCWIIFLNVLKYYKFHLKPI